MSTADTHTIQFCCGTTCDAEANLEYVRELEQDRHNLRDDLGVAQRTIRLLHRSVERRDKMIAVMEETISGLTTTHTKGATR